MKRIKTFFRFFGLEVTSRRDNRTTLFQSLDYHINKININIDVFVDVGVAEGTPAIYELLPKTKGILIDPIKTDKVNSILKKHPTYSFLLGAAGNPVHENLIPFYHKKNLNGSSFYASIEEKKSAQKIDVEVISISKIIEGLHYSDVLLKLDVEGSELDVIKELSNVACEKIKILVVEVNFKPKHKGVPDFAVLHNEISHKGFILSDILDIRYYRGDLFQADIVYLPSEE